MSNTVDSSDLVDLEALRTALQRLKTFPLPVKTRVALEDAILKVDRLVKIPASQSGQNRLDALYRLSQVIGSSLDLDQVLLQVMDAVIDLTGKLMKQEASMGGGTSTVAARREIRAAANSPDVSAILLRIDSPGGTTESAVEKQ
jgi:ClpP class serine protease